jgi:hypothetical protein
MDDKGASILSSSDHVGLWATGRRYNGTKGETKAGNVDAPQKAKGLLDSDGKLFYRSRPQYEQLSVDNFLVATKQGCVNDGTGDNTNAINAFLQTAKDQGKIAYFPAGIYRHELCLSETHYQLYVLTYFQSRRHR